MTTNGGMGKSERQDYKTAHPEMEKGEMFFKNIAKTHPYEYARIGWCTKRKGKKAYDIGGAFIPDLVPVFIQRKEYEEGMKKYE